MNLFIHRCEGVPRKHLISGYHLWGKRRGGRVDEGKLEDIRGILSAGDGGYDLLEPVLINKGTRQRA